jgi:hypothetical protein
VWVESIHIDYWINFILWLCLTCVIGYLCFIVKYLQLLMAECHIVMMVYLCGPTSKVFTVFIWHACNTERYTVAIPRLQLLRVVLCQFLLLYQRFCCKWRLEQCRCQVIRISSNMTLSSVICEDSMYWLLNKVIYIPYWFVILFWSQNFGRGT